jgi:autotransporter-associated beta strand protein
VLTLSGASTYTGATAVNAGTLQAGAVKGISPNAAVAALQARAKAETVHQVRGTARIGGSRNKS